MKARWCLSAALALGSATGVWGDEPAAAKGAAPKAATKATSVRAAVLIPATPLTPATKATKTADAVPATPVIAATPTTPATPAASGSTPAGRFLGSILKALSGGDSQPAITIEGALDGAANLNGPAPADASHQPLKTVRVAGEGGATLQTLAVAETGEVVCLIGPARYAAVGAGSENKLPPSEIHVFDRDGKLLQHWSVPFTGQSVALGGKGEIWVAGDGHVARYTADGKLDVQVEVPHIREMLNNREAMEKQAREQIEATRKSYEQQLAELKKQLEEAKKREAEKPAEEVKRPMPRVAGQPVFINPNDSKFIEQQIQAYENAMKTVGNQRVEDIIRQNLGRLRTINGLSVTDKEIFLMCGETQGYGFSLWRMDLQLTKSEKLLSRLSGCCGQMDVQVRGETIAIAENTRHRVARYDLEGALVDSFGVRGRESKGNSFGGCCNPMNCRIMPNGDVYTSESEGIVKRFNAKGEFVEFVGMVKLTGGCKNVAVAASVSGDRVYFCDQPGSQFIILERKPVAETTAAAGGE